MSKASTFKLLYYKSTGYSYTNMGRLFLRLFVGMMLMQFGVRQIIAGCTGFGEGTFFLSTAIPLWLPIIEIFCSFCIMIGFLTRAMIVPPFILMIIYAVQYYQTCMIPGVCDFSVELFSLPFMFLGIYAFILIVGPGKISIDYFLSLYLINRNHGTESDLEEV